MIRAILQLCSRDRGHEALYDQLSRACAAISAPHLWHELIYEAEKQGIAPLLKKHLEHIDCRLPSGERRMLRDLFLRARRCAAIRNEAVAEVLQAYQRAGIEVMAVKGIALANGVYDEAGSRPMRDVDLLVRKADLADAAGLLQELGYRQEENHAIPADYYHLAPMRKSCDGLGISIELHHNLLPFQGQYPLWPLEKSLPTSRTITINETIVQTMSLEETLWYVYLHGFQAPLTYEPFRLIHVADMISITEKYSDVIDWPLLEKQAPFIQNILSRLHHLTPLSDKVTENLDLKIDDTPAGIGRPYGGWPLRKLQTVTWAQMGRLAKETLWPAQWWLQLYYGPLGGTAYLRARLFEHPRTIWRWIKTLHHSSSVDQS